MPRELILEQATVRVQSPQRSFGIPVLGKLAFRRFGLRSGILTGYHGWFPLVVAARQTEARGISLVLFLSVLGPQEQLRVYDTAAVFWPGGPVLSPCVVQPHSDLGAWLWQVPRIVPIFFGTSKSGIFVAGTYHQTATC